MDAIKFFLKWFLMMVGIIGAAGCGIATISMLLFGGSWIAIIICAICTAFGIALAITCFEFMD